MKSSDVFLALMVAAGVCTPAWSQDDRRGVRGDPNSSTSAETSTAGGAQPDPLGGYDDPYVKGSLESPYMTSAPESNGPYGYEEGAGSNSYDPYQPLHQYPQFGEPFGRAPGGAAAASNSAAESAPNPAGFRAALSAGLDGFNLNPAEPNPLGASQLGLPVQMGDHQQGSGHASETSDWSRDDQGDLQGDPYRSSSSASALGTNSPFDPKSLTKRYQTYNKRPGEGREFNPYASDAPQADGDNGEGDEAYPDGLANPYDSNVRSRGYGGSVATYGHSLDSPRRAATGPLKHNDQFGRRSDGLTTYTYDPCATVNPYEHDGDPCGASAQADSFRDYDNPYSSRSLENPYVARTTGNYGQYGYSGVTVSNPYDPYRLPHGNQSLENPYMAGATGNGQYRHEGTASNRYDPYHPYPRPGEPLGRAALAPSASGAAANSVGESTPSATRLDDPLKTSLDSLNQQLKRAEADLRAASGPGLPGQIGGHDPGSAAAAETRPDRPNSKPRDGNPYGGRAAAKPRTPDQYGVHNEGSNSSISQTASDPIARGVH